MEMDRTCSHAWTQSLYECRNEYGTQGTDEEDQADQQREGLTREETSRKPTNQKNEATGEYTITVENYKLEILKWDKIWYTIKIILS